MLFGGWGGLRPPGGWSPQEGGTHRRALGLHARGLRPLATNIQEEMGHLRLDAPCAGVVVRFVLCAELCFHARDTYGALHAEPTGARLGFMRAVFASLIVGMDSEGRAVPDPIDDAIRVPREALLLRPAPGPTRPPMHSAAVGPAQAPARAGRAPSRALSAGAPHPVGAVSALAPPPLGGAEAGFFFRDTALPTGGRAECAAPPYTRCLTARSRRTRLFFPPMPPGEQYSTAPWPSARAYASRHSLPSRLS